MNRCKSLVLKYYLLRHLTRFILLLILGAVTYISAWILHYYNDYFIVKIITAMLFSVLMLFFLFIHYRTYNISTTIPIFCSISIFMLIMEIISNSSDLFFRSYVIYVYYSVGELITIYHRNIKRDGKELFAAYKLWFEKRFAASEKIFASICDNYIEKGDVKKEKRMTEIIKRVHNRKILEPQVFMLIFPIKEPILVIINTVIHQLTQRSEKLFLLGRGKYGRVIRMSRKPLPEEFDTTAKMVIIFILTMGLLGYLIKLLITIIR